MPSVKIRVMRGEGLKHVTGRRQQTPYVHWRLETPPDGTVKTKGAAQWKTVAEGATAVSHGSDDPVWDEEDPDQVYVANRFGDGSDETGGCLRLKFTVYDRKMTRDKLIGEAIWEDLQDYSAPDHVAVNRALPVDSGGAIAVRVEFTSFTAAADMPGSGSDGAGAGVAYDDDDDEDDGDDYAAYQSDDSTGAAPSASAPPKPLALDMYIHGAVNLKRVVQGLRSQTPCVTYQVLACPGSMLPTGGALPSKVARAVYHRRASTSMAALRLMQEGATSVASGPQKAPSWDEDLPPILVPPRYGPSAGGTLSLKFAVYDKKMLKDTHIGSAMWPRVEEWAPGDDSRVTRRLRVDTGGFLTVSIVLHNFPKSAVPPMKDEDEAGDDTGDGVAAGAPATATATATGAGGGAGASGGRSAARRPSVTQVASRNSARRRSRASIAGAGAAAGAGAGGLGAGGTTVSTTAATAGNGAGNGAAIAVATTRSSSSSGKALGDWVARSDGAGNTYYFNETTLVSSWTLPSGATLKTGAGAETELAAGWEARKDPSSGYTYYYNASTFETTWTKPAASAATTTGAGATGTAGASPEWTGMVDEQGRVYYLNSSSGESTWVLPDDVKAASPWQYRLDDAGRTYFEHRDTRRSSWTAEGTYGVPTSAGEWEVRVDEYGNKYGYNKTTNRSSWSLHGASTTPAAASATAASGSGGGGGAAASSARASTGGWELRVDGSGNEYAYNAALRRSSWSLHGAKPRQQQQQQQPSSSHRRSSGAHAAGNVHTAARAAKAHRSSLHVATTGVAAPWVPPSPHKPDYRQRVPHKPPGRPSSAAVPKAKAAQPPKRALPPGKLPQWPPSLEEIEARQRERAKTTKKAPKLTAGSEQASARLWL